MPLNIREEVGVCVRVKVNIREVGVCVRVKVQLGNRLSKSSVTRSLPYLFLNQNKKCDFKKISNKPWIGFYPKLPSYRIVNAVTGLLQ